MVALMTANAARAVELGKSNAKRTGTLREVRLGKFQQFICKPVPLWDVPPTGTAKDQHVSE
jgi:hypothetical protein